MLLSHIELVELVDQGVIEGVQPGAINAASIDVRLGERFMVEAASITRELRVVNLAKRESLRMRTVDVAPGANIRMHPGQFALAHTIERFNLPNDISAQFLLKSSIARSGLDHLSATWCDAGWNGSVLTLEIRNVTQTHHLVLEPGMFIGQMKFYRHTPVPDDQSYAVRGRYNGDSFVSGIKP